MKKQPNILFLMADQLRFDSLGCYGNRQIQTPNLDQLALCGSVFDNHIIQNPVCSPSRCSILTGRYPHSHGTRDNGIPLRDEELSLVQIFQSAGYETAALGKMHFTPQFLSKDREEEDWPSDHYGFHLIHTTCDCKRGEYLEWLQQQSPQDYQLVKAQGERKAQEDRASAWEKDLSGPPQVYDNPISPQFHQSTWIADRVIDFLEQAKPDQPFFALCSFVDPHHPFDPPQPYAQLYDPDQMAPPLWREGELEDKPPHFLQHRMGQGYGNEKYDYRQLTPRQWGEIKAAYYGMISLIDHEVGRILQTLQRLGMAEDTLVLFTSDHGELLGDHGLLFKGPFLYDSLIKAPLILRYPGVVPQGSRYKQITEHIDLLPTLLELAGIPSPHGVQGMSMAPILRGDRGGGRSYALTEFSCSDWGLDLKAITSRRYKLVYYAGEDFGELYDRSQDPQEWINLWKHPDYQTVKGTLLCVLLDRLIQTEDTLPLRLGKY